MAAPAAGPPALRVRVIGAQHLQAMDMNGKSDPFVILRWDAQPRHYTKQAGKVDSKVNKAAKHGKVPRQQTTVQHKTLNPTWNQSFDMVLMPPVQVAGFALVRCFVFIQSSPCSRRTF